MPRLTAPCLFALITLLFLTTGNSFAAEPVDIGSRLELMVDDSLIESQSENARFELHHPTPREIVFTYDKPWEGSGCGYQSIFKDGDKYRMYYKAWHLDVQEKKLGPNNSNFTCYAESDDGIHWRKPDLGLHEFQGSKSNNLILTGRGTHNFTAFKDSNPACPPEARYKALGGTGGVGKGLLYFRSADGIHWEMAQDAPVITEGAFDSQNLAFWDSHRGEYRAYWRIFSTGVRAIRTATSK
ncbi:MAG: hypothetical protein KDL87_19310, partial [Verrucomicrobiae bacterium]|nr:hypothetical protein [Verrucomicrobiae bacterium]